MKFESAVAASSYWLVSDVVNDCRRSAQRREKCWTKIIFSLNRRRSTVNMCARGESRDFSWLDRSLYLCVAEKTKGSVEITWNVFFFSRKCFINFHREQEHKFLRSSQIIFYWLPAPIKLLPSCTTIKFTLYRQRGSIPHKRRWYRAFRVFSEHFSCLPTYLHIAFINWNEWSSMWRRKNENVKINSHWRLWRLPTSKLCQCCRIFPDFNKI